MLSHRRAFLQALRRTNVIEDKETQHARALRASTAPTEVQASRIVAEILRRSFRSTGFQPVPHSARVENPCYFKISSFPHNGSTAISSFTLNFAASWKS